MGICGDSNYDNNKNADFFTAAFYESYREKQNYPKMFEDQKKYEAEKEKRETESKS